MFSWPLRVRLPSRSNDPQLTSTVSALSQISRIQEEYSIQRGLIVYSLTATKFPHEHVPGAECLSG